MKLIIAQRHVDSKRSFIALSMFLFILVIAIGLIITSILQEKDENPLPIIVLGGMITLIIAITLAFLPLWYYSKQIKKEKTIIVFDSKKLSFEFGTNDNKIIVPINSIVKIKADNSGVIFAGRTMIVYPKSYGKIVVKYWLNQEKMVLKTCAVDDVMKVVVKMEDLIEQYEEYQSVMDGL